MEGGGEGGGIEKVLLEIGGSQEWVVWFYNGPPILPTPPFSKFVLLPLLCHLQPPPALPILFSCFFSWMGDDSRCDAILLNDNMDLYMLSLGTIVPEGPWCVFYATRHEVYWGLIYNMVFYWYPDLISHKRTQHTQRPVYQHTHINIYLHYLLCAQSRCLYYIKWLNE